MDPLFFFLIHRKSCSWTRALAHRDNSHNDLLSSPEGPYLLFNIESLIQSQVLLLLCLRHTLKGLSLLVKNKTKQSPKQNAVTATPSTLIRQSFQRNLTLRSRKTWPLSLQFTFPRFFENTCQSTSYRAPQEPFRQGIKNKVTAWAAKITLHWHWKYSKYWQTKPQLQFIL